MTREFKYLPGDGYHLMVEPYATLRDFDSILRKSHKVINIEFDKLANATDSSIISNLLSSSDINILNITGQITDFTKFSRIPNVEGVQIQGVSKAEHVRKLRLGGIKKLKLPGITGYDAVAELSGMGVPELWLDGVVDDYAVGRLALLNKNIKALSLAQVSSAAAVEALYYLSSGVTKIMLNGINTRSAVSALKYLSSHIKIATLNGIDTKDAMKGMPETLSNVDTLILNGIRSEDAQQGLKHIPTNIKTVGIHEDAIAGMKYMPGTVSAVIISGTTKRPEDIKFLPDNIEEVYWAKEVYLKEDAIKLAARIRDNISGKSKQNVTSRIPQYFPVTYAPRVNPLAATVTTMSKRVQVLEQENIEWRNLVKRQEIQLREKDAIIARQNNAIESRDYIINDQKSMILCQSDTIQNQNKTINSQKSTIDGLTEELKKSKARADEEFMRAKEATNALAKLRKARRAQQEPRIWTDVVQEKNDKCCIVM